MPDYDGGDEPLVITALFVVALVLLGLVLDVAWAPVDWWKGRKRT